MVHFLSLGSGSSGNCYYIGNEESALLIDAGIGIRTLKKRLQENNLSIESVKMVMVTHCHFDHTKSLLKLLQRHSLPLFLTRNLLCSLMNIRGVGPEIRDYATLIQPGLQYQHESILFSTFVVPHDAPETLGYHICIDGFRFTLATDIGAVTPELLYYGAMSNALIIEANYDRYMLDHGPYSPDLRARISQGNGHLSNRQCAEAVVNIINNGWQQYKTYPTTVLLCHLSKENNTPELAYNTVSGAINSLGLMPGRDIYLEALPRTTTGNLLSWDIPNSSL